MGSSTTILELANNYLDFSHERFVKRTFYEKKYVFQRFLKHISEEFRQRTFDNVFQGTAISFAVLGADAGYLGAAGYARKQHAEEKRTVTA